MSEAQRVSRDRACHVVQFYGNEYDLLERVVGYLADGIEDGEEVIVVASAAHRLAFDASLKTRGVDVAAARASGSYVVVDAETTMREFLVSDWPDPAGFGSTVGALIRQAHGTGRPVRVYGEMVALLLDAGHVNAAIELEALWNELASQLNFSLFCAYPTLAVAGDEQHDAFTEVCRMHSAVVGQAAAGAVSGPPPEDDGQGRWVTIVDALARFT